MKQAYLSAIGRALMALLFIGSGLSKLGAAEATTAYIASVGLPFASVVYALTVLVEIGGGVLLLLGYQFRPVATILALFTLAAGLIFHSNLADQNQMIHLMKNFAIAGGLLHMAATGTGRLSIDARRA